MSPAQFELAIYVHIILFLFVTTSLASTLLSRTSITTPETSPKILLSRATPKCPSSAVPCGTICIPSDYTCCPDHSGGCSTNEVCQVGDNSAYGCCPTGEVCTGDGGSQFIDEKIGGDDAEGGGDGDGNGDGGEGDSPLGSNAAGRLSMVDGSVLFAVGVGLLGLL